MDKKKKTITREITREIGDRLKYGADHTVVLTITNSFTDEYIFDLVGTNFDRVANWRKKTVMQVNSKEASRIMAMLEKISEMLGNKKTGVGNGQIK